MDVLFIFWTSKRKITRLTLEYQSSPAASRQIRARHEGDYSWAKRNAQRATNVTGTVEDHQNGWVDPWISHLLLVHITNFDGGRTFDQ